MPEYSFDTLSSTDFEYLVCDLLNAELGFDLHRYAAGADRGIDLLQDQSNGFRIVAQCKHYLHSSKSHLLKAAEEDARKEGRSSADRYIWATSYRITSQIETKLMKILAIPQEDVWGPGRLNDALGRHPEIEQRHFKLWLRSANVLSLIMNAGCWNRGRASLSATAERAKYWVEIPQYKQAQDTLEREGVCVLTGPPGVGKTYLADIITLRRARDGWQVADTAANVDTAWSVLRHDDSRQVFIFADPLGEADLTAKARDNAPDLRRFITHIADQRNNNKRLLVTTPTETLRQATLSGHSSLRRLAEDRLRKYEVMVADWPEEARRDLLLNHLEFVGVSADVSRAVARSRTTNSVIRHAAFSPRLVEAICEQFFSSETTMEEVFSQLDAALEYPNVVWGASWTTLRDVASEIVLTLATFEPRAVPLRQLRSLVGHDGPAKQWGEIVQSLEPIWIRVTGPSSDRAASLANPGLRGFLLGVLEREPSMAEERVAKSRTLEQLTQLGIAAGHLTAAVPSALQVDRPTLGQALRARRSEVASRTQELAKADLDRVPRRSAARTLRDAVALLAVYGSADVIEWVAEKVNELPTDGNSISVSDGLALATKVRGLPANERRDEIIAHLRAVALAHISTLGDLDAVEAYASELDIDLPAVGRQAREVIVAELMHLEDERDSEVIRKEAYALRERAELYDQSVEIYDLLDYAAELEAE